MLSLVKCPGWVKSVGLTFNQPLPVYSDQRTLSGPSGWSVWCQYATLHASSKLKEPAN
jgi:hypothetical protein